MQRHDGDRQLRRLLIDEAVAGLLGSEQRKPGGPDRLPGELGDDARVVGPSPTFVVSGEHGLGQHFFDRHRRPVGVPPRGLVEHPSQEVDVAPRGGTDVHHSSISAATACSPSIPTARNSSSRSPIDASTPTISSRFTPGAKAFSFSFFFIEETFIPVARSGRTSAAATRSPATASAWTTAFDIRSVRYRS